ncbi:MAG: hypothetical protein MR894_08335 [Akkermansia muciniphila]|nr:hypothetical protein [Akkermansia muciniphila]
MSKDKMSTASEKPNRRFYGVPGVKYPEPEATGRRAMPGLNPETGRAYEVAPEGCICTDEAAALLGVTPRTARRQLHKACRTCYLVHRHYAQIYYWRRTDVIDLLRCKKLLTKKKRSMPEPEYVTPTQTMILLHISSTTMRRLEARGHLTRVSEEEAKKGALRERVLYSFEDVLKLAERIHNMRRAVTWYRTEMTNRWIHRADEVLLEAAEEETIPRDTHCSATRRYGRTEGYPTDVRKE